MKLKNTQLWLYKCLTSKNQLFSKGLGEEDIEDFTNDFLIELRGVFEHFVQAFNELKKTLEKGENWDAKLGLSLTEKDKAFGKSQLKGSLLIYDLADKKGFMLFRKSCKLVFSSVQPGKIRVQFLKQKPLGETEQFTDTFIRAITNDTLSANWVHENHKGFVNIPVLARYYMRRFLREN